MDEFIRVSYKKHCSPIKKFIFDAKCESYIRISQVKCRPQIRIPKDKCGPQTHVSKTSCGPQSRIFEAKCRSDICVSESKQRSQICISEYKCYRNLASNAHGILVLVISTSSEAHSLAEMAKVMFSLTICKGVDDHATKILFGMDIASFNNPTSSNIGDLGDFFQSKETKVQSFLLSL